jgi:hypothetical protein
MSMELWHVWQGNVFFLKTHYEVWRHLSHICISNKVENLDMQERIQSFRKQVILRNCRIGTLKYQPQNLAVPNTSPQKIVALLWDFFH